MNVPTNDGGHDGRYRWFLARDRGPTTRFISSSSLKRHQIVCVVLQPLPCDGGGTGLLRDGWSCTLASFMVRSKVQILSFLDPLLLNIDMLVFVYQMLSLEAL
ncbi:hypothetical protein R6Q59_035870 [Mikania micrantha]